MAKEQLWSISTTMREAERTIGFLLTASELENQDWDVNNQKKMQILLVKNRYYLDDENNTQNFNKLNACQIAILKDKTHAMTYDEAKSIIEAKQYVGGAEMRGRQSMNAIRKLGLVSTSSGKVAVTDLGKNLMSGQISISEFMLDSLLKYQLPNPNSPEYKRWNNKPFISALRLIRTVNNLCIAKGEKAKGISTKEFGIFVLSLRKYDDVEKVAELLLQFRNERLKLLKKEQDDFEIKYIKTYLKDFNNPIKKIRDYTDNIIRNLRITKYIYIRGKYEHTYIDLEPRRTDEINTILANDTGAAKEYTMSEWEKYIGTYGSYILPFETVPMLTQIAKDIINEINVLADSLKQKQIEISLPTTVVQLKKTIEDLRTQRTALQNLELKNEYHTNLDKIDEAIEALKNILTRNKAKLNKRYSIELEKWTNIALNILNDALQIKPNTIVGDDNEPIFTAPGGVADIECYYDDFNAICEVTMLKSRDQWYNEGQPVMRHLRSFENVNNNAYCLFVAPSLHVDTVNTFWMATKYEYEGAAQKIVPITISQLITLIETVKLVQKHGKRFTHQMLEDFYIRATTLTNVQNSTAWLSSIQEIIFEWKQDCIA